MAPRFGSSSLLRIEVYFEGAGTWVAKWSRDRDVSAAGVVSLREQQYQCKPVRRETRLWSEDQLTGLNSFLKNGLHAVL